MIDIENVVFDKVAKAVRTQFATAYPKIKVYGEYVAVPAEFPCVNIVEDNNETYQRSITLDNLENHAQVVYSVAVYTNDNKKKQSAKTIIKYIDEQFRNMGFVRTMVSQIPNQDRTIYRIVARYSGVVDKGHTVGNNTIYKVYGR